MLELLKQAFPRLSLPNIALWEKQFADDAAEQLAEARAAMERSDYSAAREAVRSAQGILPSAPGAVELMEEIQDTWPQVVVGVAELAPEGADPLVCWAAARVNPLLEERLVRLIDFGNEGPVFQCPWAEIQTDDTGEVLSVTPNQKAEACGVTPDRLALGLLAMVDPHNRDYAVGLAASLREVSLAEGRSVELLCRNHIRPESLLDVPLSAISPTALGQYTIGPREAQRATYLAREAAAGSPKAIVEQAFPSDGEALHALVTGQVDALDRVPPWRVDTVTGDRNLRLGTYRLPTVHVLLLNFDNPLLGRAEFRRALAYGIDRERLLSEILLAGKTRPGFQVVSGPLPAGVSLTDPVGDSYNRQIRPRPYAPRLASLLAKVSRIAILKPYEKKEGDDSAAPPGDPPDVERPLVLLHGADPVATTACQSIGRQLSAIGIPVELKRLDNSGGPLPEHDLYYCELSVGEPLNDVRRLLGPQGLAGRCTPRHERGARPARPHRELERRPREARRHPRAGPQRPARGAALADGQPLRLPKEPHRCGTLACFALPERRCLASLGRWRCEVKHYALLLTLVFSLATTADARQKYWSLSPYNIRLVLAVDASLGGEDRLADELAETITDRVRSTLAPRWALDLVLTEGEDRYTLISAPDATLGEVGDDPVGVDKWMFLTVEATPAGYALRCRERDCRVDRWGATHKRLVRQRLILGEACFALLRDTFAPLVEIHTLPEKPDRVEARFKGSELPAREPVGSFASAGDVYLPLIARTDRSGEIREGSTFDMPWTYLTLAEPEGQGWLCEVHSGTKNPYGLRRRGRIQRLALAVRNRPAPHTGAVLRSTRQEPLAHRLRGLPPRGRSQGKRAPGADRHPRFDRGQPGRDARAEPVPAERRPAPGQGAGSRRRQTGGRGAHRRRHGPAAGPGPAHIAPAGADGPGGQTHDPDRPGPETVGSGGRARGAAATQ